MKKIKKIFNIAFPFLLLFYIIGSTTISVLLGYFQGPYYPMLVTLFYIVAFAFFYANVKGFCEFIWDYIQYDGLDNDIILFSIASGINLTISVLISLYFWLS